MTAPSPYFGDQPIWDGKTNVHNLEPEDMRTISLATSEALGIPLAAGQGARGYF